eukprot:1134727-Prymnesium_polylepis.2
MGVSISIPARPPVTPHTAQPMISLPVAIIVLSTTIGTSSATPPTKPPVTWIPSASTTRSRPSSSASACEPSRSRPLPPRLSTGGLHVHVGSETIVSPRRTCTERRKGLWAVGNMALCVCDVRWWQLHFCVWLPGLVWAALEGCRAP